MSMTVHLYAICWNEERMLPFFFRHYDPWVDRYVIFDNGSTDGTIEILKAHPHVTLRRFPRSDPQSFVHSAQSLHDCCWKESRGTANWVVISAIDEHLYHKDITAYLRTCRTLGVTLVPALGYQMLSCEAPDPHETLVQSRTHGAPWANMSKLCLFRPDRLTETDYGTGRHLAQPKGEVRYPDRDELLNLHYKYLGFEETYARNLFLRTGLGPTDLALNMGHKYSWDRMRLEEDWAQFESRQVDISTGGFSPSESHRETRWWRCNTVERND